MHKFTVKQWFFAIVVGLFSLLTVLSFVAHTQKTQRINSVHLNEPEMVVEDTAARERWNVTDFFLNAQFFLEYRFRNNKRMVFEKFIDSLGGGAMLDYLEEWHSHCHRVAHDLGKVVFAHSKDINQALRTCGNGCTNACMHGVLTEAFGVKESEKIASKMNSFCKEGEMAKLHKPGNCAHGIGHALMITTHHNLDKSLSFCEEFSTSGMDHYCATGVFMEYTEHKKMNHKEIVKNPTLHYPCDIYTEFSAACYRYRMPKIRTILKNDRKRLVKECQKLPDSQRRGCFHGLGKAYQVTVNQNPTLLPEVCLVGRQEDQIMCIEGVIEKLADYDQKTAMLACSYLKGENAKVCYEAGKEKMYRINKPTMKLYRS